MKAIKTYCLFFVFLLFICKIGTSQNLDSLYNSLSKANPVEKVDVYKQLSNYYLLSNTKLSRLYANKGLIIAKALGHEDEIVDFYFNVSDSYFEEKVFDTSLFYLDSAYLYLVKSKNEKQQAILFFYKGKILYSKEEYNQAEDFFKQSLDIYTELNDTFSIIASYERLGMTNYMKANYSKAIEFFLIELKLAEQNSFKEAQASSRNNIAMAYSTDGDFLNSLKYYKEALKIYESLENLKGLATVFNNIGNIYTSLNKPDSALAYFKQALKCSSDLNDDIYIAISQTNMAEIYIQLKDFVEAEKLLIHCEEVFQKYQLFAYLAAVYYLYGNLYNEQNNIQKTQSYILMSLKYSVASNNKDFEKDNYKFLSSMYIEMGDYKNGYDYFKKYTDLKDSLYNLENSLKINQLKINYETEKKDKEIQLNKLKISRQQKLIIYFIIAMVVFVVLIGFILFFFKKLNYSYAKLVEINLELVETCKTDQDDNSFSSETKINYIDDPDESILKPEQIELLRKGVENLINEKIFLKSDITLDKMSRILNTNKLYLSKFINIEYKKNFNTFINAYRIKEAQKLLKSPDYKNYSLDGIAQTVGFKSRSSFYSVFKRITGVTPSFYKKQIQSHR
ncbi:MAG: tetratricopeptide repeat protein [Bacteroidales bacterium]|nr:tetratricopeptide repeat protein [Bacteroidales bacterium]